MGGKNGRIMGGLWMVSSTYPDQILGDWYYAVGASHLFMMIFLFR